VGGEAWWWHSFASELFFVGRGREKSLSACSTLTRCRFRVTPFLPKGVVGSLCLLYSEPGETLGSSGPGSSAVSTVLPFLKVLALGALECLERGRKSRRAQRLRASSLRRFVVVFISFCFGHVLMLPQHFLCLKLVYQCGCYIIYSGAKACFVKQS
jgi:hypothetical protein